MASSGYNVKPGAIRMVSMLRHRVVGKQWFANTAPDSTASFPVFLASTSPIVTNSDLDFLPGAGLNGPISACVIVDSSPIHHGNLPSLA